MPAKQHGMCSRDTARAISGDVGWISGGLEWISDKLILDVISGGRCVTSDLEGGRTVLGSPWMATMPVERRDPSRHVGGVTP